MKKIKKFLTLLLRPQAIVSMAFSLLAIGIVAIVYANLAGMPLDDQKTENSQLTAEEWNQAAVMVNGLNSLCPVGNYVTGWNENGEIQCEALSVAGSTCVTNEGDSCGTSGPCYQQGVIDCDGNCKGDEMFTSGQHGCNSSNVCTPNGVCCNAATPDGVSTHKLVFETLLTFNGDLGGVSGADTKCQNYANDQGYNGTYKAWIANDDVKSAPINTFTRSNVPYKYRTGGTINCPILRVIADDWTDLIDGTIEYRIGNEPNKYTNVDIDGSVKGNNDCNGWTSSSSSVYGHVGRGGLSQYNQDYHWTDQGNVGCHKLLKLMCFEQ